MVIFSRAKESFFLYTLVAVVGLQLVCRTHKMKDMNEHPRNKIEIDLRNFKNIKASKLKVKTDSDIMAARDARITNRDPIEWFI